MMGSEVTVLIPFYNTKKEYLAQALESVFQQSYQGWKIILIDDGSVTDCLTGLEKYLKDPRVNLLVNKENVGQSKCLNIGLAAVKTPYVVQLDSDDWFYTDTLKILLKEMKKQDHDVAVVSGNIHIIYEDEKGKIVKQVKKKGRNYKDKYEFMLANKSIWPRFYKTKILKKVGGWPVHDPHEGRYVEDLAILFKLIEHYRFHWVDRFLLYHRRHTHNQTNHYRLIGETVEWIIKDTLKRWGNKYNPIMKVNREGYKNIVGLKRKRG